jgi:SAM-dependent methyltransferase
MTEHPAPAPPKPTLGGWMLLLAFASLIAATVAASFWLRPTPLDGRALYNQYRRWEKTAPAKDLTWEQKQSRYKQLLTADGVTPQRADEILRLISARDEAVLYDPLYAAKVSPVPTKPTPLLRQALQHHPPGDALDAGAGNGRNAVLLAQNGWHVTAFDVSAAGLIAAQRAAEKRKVRFTTLQSAAEEFEFGRNRWDLIAILYPIEKHTIHQVPQALRPGGLVVLECGLRTGPGAAFEYEPGEVKRLLPGFEFLFHEEGEALHEWTGKRQPMVRLIARKLP